MKKNLVVIGYGGMGGWHTQHALNSDAVNLLGIYDIKEERRALARERGIYAYESLEEVLADERVDLVTVAIPNDVHKETVIRALKGGKNVICEKPVTTNSKDLADMIATANETGKLFTVHQNRRWDVDFLAMKKIYNEDLIGDVFNIESRIHGSRGIPSDWRGEKEHGGGMMLDWGVHLIDQILQIITDKIDTVYCQMGHITNNEVDDGFKLYINFETGRQAYVEVGTYNFIDLPRFYMQGKKGTAMIRDWRENCRIVECTHWHESEVVPVQTAAGLTKTMAPRDSVTTKDYEIERPASDVHDFYRNVCAAIDGKEQQLVKHDQIMLVMKVMEAAFESDEKKQVVKF